MTLPSSGAISLNQMHVEVGGSSGSQASLNDSDIRGLISKGSGAQMSFNEWYGASAFTPDTRVTITPASSGFKNDNVGFRTWQQIVAVQGSFTDNEVTPTQGNTYYIHGFGGSQNSTTGYLYFSNNSNPASGGGSASFFNGDYWRNSNGIYVLSTGTANSENDQVGNIKWQGFKATVATNNPGVNASSQNYDIY